MATWKQGEIEILQRYFEGRGGPATGADYEALQEQLPGRTVPAIKKKTLQIRGNGPARAAVINAWTDDETHRLQAAYMGAEGRTKTQKLRNIAEHFPGRSEKALATQLRSKLPEIYYGRAEQPVEQPIENRVEEPRGARGRGPARDDDGGRRGREVGASQSQGGDIEHAAHGRALPAPAPQRPSGASGSRRAAAQKPREPEDSGPQLQVEHRPGPHIEEQRPGPQRPGPRIQAEERHPGPQIQVEEQHPGPQTTDEHAQAYESLRRRFRRTWSRVAGAGRKVGRIGNGVNRGVVAMVDTCLQEALEEVEAGGGTKKLKREKAKRAIHAAGIVLSQENRKIGKRRKPKHVAVQEVIDRLEAKVDKAKQLRNWKSGTLKHPIKMMTREIRSARLSPTQYIAVTGDRIQTLKKSRQYQRELEEAQKLRTEFAERPSIAVIRDQPTRAEVSVEAVEAFYGKLYSATD